MSTPQPPETSSSQQGSQYDTIAPQSTRASQSPLESKAITSPPPEKDPAKNVNRYLTKNFHARGGMGEVWVSEDPHLGREVAIKRLSVSGAGAAERFIAEAQVTGQLQHPCIVPVHDIGHDDFGQPFYVMKFVRGKSLKETIGEYHRACSSAGQLAELQRAHLLNVFVGICQAVAYAHSRGVLHRDIKPDNIMLGEYGEIVLLDWGLAKVSGRGELGGDNLGANFGANFGANLGGSLGGGSFVQTGPGSLADTQAGSVLGSPLYMPPEMAEGRTPETDERTDVYLLGATLYEILTGHTPREGRSRSELIDLARTAQPLAPRKICNVDKPIEAICLKAMARRKEDRYAHVSELLDDMKRYLVSEPVAAYPEGLAARTWRWCKRHRVALRRTAAMLVLAVGCTIGIVKYRQLESRRALAQLQAQQAQQRELARLQIQTFDHLADEARFFAASTDPVTEHAPYFDVDKAAVAEEAALAQTVDWGPHLERLVFPDEAPRLRGRMYELLLLMAQGKIGRPSNNSAGDNSAGDSPAKAALSYLDRAAQMTTTPTRGYYRLENVCLTQLNDPAAAKSAYLASAPSTPSNAFDFFLLAEDLRRQAVATDEAVYSGLQDPHDRSDRINQAVKEYDNALKLDPTLYWAHFQLGRCYLSLGRTSDAVEELGTCVALRPDAPWSYSARGMALGFIGRFDEAKADLNHAIQLDPDFLPALLNRGAVSWLANDSSAAIADFTRILQAPENHRLIEAAFYRAQIFMQQGDLDRAMTDLDSVVTAEPTFSSAVLFRGRVELLKGNTAGCLADLNRWLEKTHGADFRSHNSSAFIERAEFLRGIAAASGAQARNTALELARQDIASAQRLGDQSSRMYADQGAILDLLGDSTSAIVAYTRSLQADPQNSTSQINRAWAYQRIGKLDQSGDDFRAVTSRDPTNAEALAGLAYIEACQKRDDAARDDASKALLAGSSDYLILHNISCVYAQLADDEPSQQTQSQDVALAMLQKAVNLWKLNPKGPDETLLIQQEPAFTASLRSRQEFQQLVGHHGN